MTELRDLEENRNLDFETYSKNRTIGRNIERIIENIINAIIDIGKIILAGEDVELPDTYREIFTKLGQLSIIDHEHCKNLSWFCEGRKYTYPPIPRPKVRDDQRFYRAWSRRGGSILEDY